ncbi:MAG: glycoside hydrolase family 92 protein, partial [Deltaproteobacteria bacterium]|nr:glycoside hydrolase family 92 protein [Deltaproteobacteria bacterium]
MVAVRCLALVSASLALVCACGSEPAGSGTTAVGDASADTFNTIAADAGDAASPVDASGDATSTGPDWFAAAPHAKAVDPLIGTALSVANVGSAIPGASVPWGLVKCSPDTSNKGGQQGAFHCAGYQRSDPYLHAFSHNHLQGTGAPDYGNVAVLPFATVGPEITSRNGRRSTYSHDTEVASAGYYAVTLDGPKARHELTATAHCGVHRTVFQGDSGGLLIDLSEAIAGGMVTMAKVQLDPAARTVVGELHNFGDFSNRYGGFKVYFSAQFARPWQAAGTWNEGVLSPGSLSASQLQPPAGKDRVNLGMYAQFAEPDQPVELQVCLSYVDAAGAEQNRQTEVAGKSFDLVRQAAIATWETQLAKVDIDGATPSERTIYYSALYLALAMPTLWNDVDGSYRGFDGGIH